MRIVRNPQKYVVLFLLAFSILILACSDEKVIHVDYVKPHAIQDLVINATGNGSVSLSWKAPGDNSDNSNVKSYEIRYTYDQENSACDDDDCIENWISYIPDLQPSEAGQIESITVNGLEQGPRCYIRARAIDKAGNKAKWSNLVTDFAVNNIAVNFPDSALEATVRYEMEKPEGELYYKEVLELLYLRNFSSKMSDLSGVEHLKNLLGIMIYGADVTDLKQLEDLTELTIISMAKNNISDISGIKNCTKLKVLQISFNHISDISCLSNLTLLEELGLGYNEIEDFDPISNLTNLKELFLMYTDLKDITFLESLTNLKKLWLGHNRISNITAVSGLENLQTIYLYFNYIYDIDALANLPNLHNLYLNGNKISDILPLVQNTGLGEGAFIELTGNPLSEKSINEYIPALEARGVTVVY